MELAVDTSSQTMELLCAESGESQRAFQDPVFLKDNRVIHNLMKLEGHYTIPSDYMAGQTDIKVFMRKIITQWMCEVCEEQQCEEEVFPLAVNLLDRFLAVSKEVNRNRLQLLATACMFISSKLKETCPLSSKMLVAYTDQSITIQELLDWELLVLSKLKWDISSVVAVEFLDVLLDRLELSAERLVYTRSQALKYITLCCLDATFTSYLPSMIASSCICASIASMTGEWKSGFYSGILHEITGLNLDCLRSCQEHITHTVHTGATNTADKEEKSESPGTPTDTLNVQVH